MFNNFTDFPMLDGYRSAKRHYDSIKPLTRGKNSGLRPLCNTENGRKKTHYSIWHTVMTFPQSGGEPVKAIACRLYDTDVVIYTENGYVEVNNSYVSNTTCGFVSSLLPYHCTMHATDNKCYVHDRYHNQSWYIPDGASLIFKLEDGGMTPPEPWPIKKHLINTSKAAEIYKQFDPFIKHISALHKIVDPDSFMSVEHELREPNRGWGRDRWKHVGQYAELKRCDVMKDVENKEGWGDLVRFYFANAATYDRKWVDGQYIQNWKMPIQAVRARVRESIKLAYRDEIFDEVDAPLGIVAKDPNEEYFR